MDIVELNPETSSTNIRVLHQHWITKQKKNGLGINTLI